MITKSDDSYTTAIRELLANDEYQDVSAKQEDAEEALREARRMVAEGELKARSIRMGVIERHVSLLAAKRRAIGDAVMARHGVAAR